MRIRKSYQTLFVRKRRLIKCLGESMALSPRKKSYLAILKNLKKRTNSFYFCNYIVIYVDFFFIRIQSGPIQFGLVLWIMETILQKTMKKITNIKKMNKQNYVNEIYILIQVYCQTFYFIFYELF